MRQNFPKAPEVPFNLGTAYAQQKRFKEAAAAYKEALQLDPQNSLARLSLVKALVSDFQYDAALPEIREYARQHPGEFEARYMCGLALRGVGNYTEAETELRQADKLGPDHPDVTYNLGFVYARLGKLEEARQYLEKAKRLNPESEDARYQLASVLRKLNESAQARQEFESFEEKKRQSQEENAGGAKGSEGNKLLEEGNPQRAVELYREALKLDPNNPKTHYNLALALNRLGDQPAEQQALERAVELDPKFALARNQLGLLYIDRQDSGR